MKNTVLTIAGSDCSGGAGIQADIKTIEAYGVYAMSAITAVTAQNTLGVQAVYEMSEECLSGQLESVFSDIFPDAVKIGVLANEDLIKIVSEFLQKEKAKHIVVDPVMISSSGTMLLEKKAVDNLKKMIFPLAELITPNIPEAEVLTGICITEKPEMESAAAILGQNYGGAVVLKGGHAQGSADDLLYLDGNCIWIAGERLDNSNTHGTGCTFSSAIAAGLAKGMDIEKSVRTAKEYMQKAIEAGLDLGHGNGPLEHSVGSCKY
ncbi:MAG: bifunctional hydroxymethylpyrimidine kinase/phosphomethylpyrimidine kinase [Lachnospiraceae bacterium]|jgi:hydroxymethylpyrimidine/phosphomethylpyrimidine kinase|nr:bifunctional hydroxymethylpyrimidine kinase/phosphomethylpyrimidine kinase [Lachnospiraceae bacterium]